MSTPRSGPLQIVGAHAPRGDDGWPLHDAASCRRIEAAGAAPLPPGELMRRAGVATARLALAVAPHAQRIWIAAGPGNNGGDGFAAAAELQGAGRDVTVSRPADAPSPPLDAMAALARAQAAGVRFTASPRQEAAAGGVDLAIDALFGLGQSRPIGGWALDALRSLNASSVATLAVDLPSGLHPDHGSIAGEAVRARWTLCLLALKPGLFTGHGRDAAGEVWFDDLGVDAADLDPAAAQPTCRLLTHSDALRPERAHAHHKGSYGDVWIVGGAPGMSGAPLLAARAALAAGAGRVFCVTLDPQAPRHDGLHPELMHRLPQALNDAADALARATVACGCGGGEAVVPLLPLLLSRAGRLLLDADALNAIARDPMLAALAAARGARGRPTLITPHPLEAARLLGLDTAQVQAARLSAAQELARRYGATAVLKGSGSVIASPGAEGSWINGSGNAALATAGSGDVLSGWIAGLWSQGMAPLDAARLGVHSHGLAADRWRVERDGDAALAASELLKRLTTTPVAAPPSRLQRAR